MDYVDNNQQTSSIDPNSEIMTGLSQQFTDFCISQEIANVVRQRGEHYLLELIKLNILDEAMVDQRSLFASFIYISVIESSLPYGEMDPLLIDNQQELSMTLSEILTKAEININKFFSAMHWLMGHLQISKTIQDRLKKLERKYLVASALLNTFGGRLSVAVFKEEAINGRTDNDILLPIPETEGISYRKKQCWVLYLLAKKRLLSANEELYQHFQLLLCCLEFILRQTPSFLLNEPYDAIRFSQYNQEQIMLRKLAKDFDVAVDQTLQLQTESTEIYFQSLLNPDGELDLDGLCNEYINVYEREGDINELDFLLKDSYLHPLCKVNRDQPQQMQARSLPERMTPVRLAVSTVQQFQQNFADLPDKPSEKLKVFFTKCTRDPGETISGIVQNLKEKFVREYQGINTTTSSNVVAEMRFSLGVKLYYKVLETILFIESGHLPAQVLSTLLNKGTFHTSLLACAMEVVLITYSQTWKHNVQIPCIEETFAFPWILEVFSLQAYEFYKVIESFIKAEPKLSDDVVKHLQYVEMRVLEFLAWSEKSILFEFFNECEEKGLRTPPTSVSPIKAPESSNRNAVDLFLSPVNPQPLPFTSYTLPAQASPSPKLLIDTPASEIGDKLSSQFKSQSLVHFLKRVLRLGYSRLTKLCNDLGISRELLRKIWTCFDYCVTSKPQLLKNRHIDQIIMCCIYGICKVSDNEIKFKFIVNEYKNLPYSKQEVFKYVYMEDSKYESVICFYNTVFMTSLKKYIMNFHPKTDVRQHLSPMPKQSPSYCLPGKKNFLVSPLKESFKAPSSPGQMTPGTKLLYNFGDSVGSSEKLKDINETMKKFGPARAKKRLNLDDMGSSSPKKSLLQ